MPHVKDGISMPFRAGLLLLIVTLFPAAIGHCTTAAEYRRMADRCVSSGDYAQAAEYYRCEAAIFRKIGDVNGAKVEEVKAERWSMEIELFMDTPLDSHTRSRNSTGEKFEPAYGCYFGAYLEYDKHLTCSDNASGRALAADEGFAALTGKKLAVCYDYCRYGRPFPLAWARNLCRRGVAPQIAWEPESLAQVRDNDYLRQFARAAATCNGPIFLRYACEMNGDWTPYHRDPEVYKQKFRLVHDVMARLAPNVAMIWCVNSIPENNIERYYPGDQYVDWVGVNFYSVYYHDNQRSRPASFESPTSYLKYVYQRYSAKKPIAICEFGASHQDTVDRHADRADFAATKFTQLFAALPRLFPRVKMIDIFDCNNIECARPGRQLNNYCVTDNRQVLKALKAAVAPAYFLSKVDTRGDMAAPTYITCLTPGMPFCGTVRLSAWVKSYENAPEVSYLLDGRALATLTAPGEYRTVLDTNDLAEGAHTLTVQVRDAKGRVAGKKDVAVNVMR